MKTHLAGVACVMFAFAGCGEPGRARVSDQDLVGEYVMEFGVKFVTTGQRVAAVRGKELLTLNQDKTYTQIFSSPTRNFTNHGTWKSSNEILGGTEIELSGANLSEDQPSDSQSRLGFLNLQVHREKGKLKLARNEAADSYYSRVE
jgi:hypothetical protein